MYRKSSDTLKIPVWTWKKVPKPSLQVFWNRHPPIPPSPPTTNGQCQNRQATFYKGNSLVEVAGLVTGLTEAQHCPSADGTDLSLFFAKWLTRLFWLRTNFGAGCSLAAPHLGFLAEDLASAFTITGMVNADVPTPPFSDFVTSVPSMQAAQHEEKQRNVKSHVTHLLLKKKVLRNFLLSVFSR